MKRIVWSGLPLVGTYFTSRDRRRLRRAFPQIPTTDSFSSEAPRGFRTLGESRDGERPEKSSADCTGALVLPCVERDAGGSSATSRRRSVRATVEWRHRCCP